MAQNILEDARRSPENDAKMDEYREAMQDFSLLRDRQSRGTLMLQSAVNKNVDSMMVTITMMIK